MSTTNKYISMISFTILILAIIRLTGIAYIPWFVVFLPITSIIAVYLVAIFMGIISGILESLKVYFKKPKHKQDERKN